jgi:hypothetical protein
MATLALNAGAWFRQGRLLTFFAPRNTGYILSPWSSTSTLRRVQVSATIMPARCTGMAGITLSRCPAQA